MNSQHYSYIYSYFCKYSLLLSIILRDKSYLAQEKPLPLPVVCTFSFRDVEILSLSFTRQHAVVGVVRERYGNRTGFSDSAHCHAFLSSLYTFLSDQLHVGLHQVSLTSNCLSGCPDYFSGRPDYIPLRTF